MLIIVDDALSTKIEIRFHSNSALEGSSKLPNLAAKCDKITFKNNGMAFRPEDWQRLKRIAEGNPGNIKFINNIFITKSILYVYTYIHT